MKVIQLLRSSPFWIEGSYLLRFRFQLFKPSLPIPTAGFRFRWRDWAGEEEVKTWTTKILADPRKALKLLERLLTVSYSSSSGKEYWLQAKSIESLVNLDCLLNAVNSIDKKRPNSMNY